MQVSTVVSAELFVVGVIHLAYTTELINAET